MQQTFIFLSVHQFICSNKAVTSMCILHGIIYCIILIEYSSKATIKLQMTQNACFSHFKHFVHLLCAIFVFPQLHYVNQVYTCHTE